MVSSLLVTQSTGSSICYSPFSEKCNALNRESDPVLPSIFHFEEIIHLAINKLNVVWKYVCPQMSPWGHNSLQKVLFGRDAGVYFPFSSL